MDHYIDIAVLPDPDLGEITLLSALFAKCHRVLPRLTAGRVGVSFPKYGKTPGNCLRLHGSLADLLSLMEDNWMAGLRDYTHTRGPLPIPAGVQYRCVRRVQAKSAHNKRQRSIAKGWLTEEQARVQIPDGQQKKMTLPYLEFTSLSTQSRMRMWVEHGPLQDMAVKGTFNAYGLSATATIPWF